MYQCRKIASGYSAASSKPYATAIMEDLNLEWLEDTSPDYQDLRGIYCPSPSASPAIEPSEPPSEPPSGEGGLPLLRLQNWEKDKQYDKNHPEFIHYDFRWKIALRENIRARQISAGLEPDTVLAPSDYWKEIFQPQLSELLTDKDKFPGNNYICEEANITINTTKTRGRNLTQCFKSLSIDWNTVDSHLKELGDLFTFRKKMDKKITVSIELIYKEVSKEPTATKGQKKRKGTGTDAQRAQLAKHPGLWKRVFERWRCRGRYCKRGPHCWPDEKGNHFKLETRYLEAIIDELKKKMKEGEKDEDVDVDFIPPHILSEVLKASQKRKASDTGDGRPCKTHVLAHCGLGCGLKAAETDSVEITGDRAQRLEEYCNYTVEQTNSDRWRSELEHVTQFAMDNFIDLNHVLQHPRDTAEFMIERGVKHGVAWQFASRSYILQWWKESQEEISSVTEYIEV
ncbi:hypothetical protein V8C42DRAFT_337869 [Trichoderma barbatum]